MAKNTRPTCHDSLSRRTFLDATAASAVILLPTVTGSLGEKTPDAAGKVLVFGQVPHKYLEQWEITSDFEVVAEKLGIRIEVIPRNELRARYEGLSEPQRSEAAALAKRLVSEAQQEGRPRPADTEIEAAVRYFMAMHSMVAERRASAATRLCGSFPPAKGPGPCAALTLLADHGVPAGCQGDIDAVLTMALFKRVAGVVSFMGGGFAQGSRLRVSHCVLPRRMKGPEASRPYYLAYHHASSVGVTIHTDLPAGEPVTVARLTQNLERLIVAEGTVVESPDPPRGCRNALLIDVADVQKLMRVVRGGQYHLVVACGHHLAKIRDLAGRAGIEVYAV